MTGENIKPQTGKSAQQSTLFEKPEQDSGTGEAAPFDLD